MHDIGASASVLSALKAIGLKWAIDDFGVLKSQEPFDPTLHGSAAICPITATPLAYVRHRTDAKRPAGYRRFRFLRLASEEAPFQSPLETPS